MFHIWTFPVFGIRVARTQPGDRTETIASLLVRLCLCHTTGRLCLCHTTGRGRYAWVMNMSRTRPGDPSSSVLTSITSP
eukprot:2773119-Pyramimonas_sp.AAC.1